MPDVELASENAVSLLDLDPDLGQALEPEDLDRARVACRARMVSIDRGPWQLPARDESPETIGFLLADGLLCREVALSGAHMVELLGDGDVVRPPSVVEWPRLGGATALTAITPIAAIVLGPEFGRAAARWPRLHVNLHDRLEEQRERLAIQGLIGHLPHAEHRLLLQLWHLAARWGRVRPDGISVPIQLTHELLGKLVGARRPTITLAVRALEAQGSLQRAKDGTWLLTPTAERAVKALIGTRHQRLVGEALMTRSRSLEIRAQSAAVVAERASRG